MIWIILVITVALLIVIVVYGSEKLLTVPRPTACPQPDDLGIAYEPVEFRTTDGITLRGWFFPRPGEPVIIYCPGRGQGLNTFDFRYAPLFYHAGYQVLMFDWRGMGASGGQSSMGYWERLDLQAAVVYLRQRGITTKIGTMGTSLGAAVVFLAAPDLPEVAAVAGECAFATFEGMIASGIHAMYRVPMIVARPLAWFIARTAALRRRFPVHGADPVRSIGRISPRPVFVIHGRDDPIIPVTCAYSLFAAAGEPKILWTPNVGHTEGLEKEEQEFRQRIIEFFDQWLKSEPY